MLLQLEGIPLAILMLPRCCFLLKYIQFLCLRPLLADLSHGEGNSSFWVLVPPYIWKDYRNIYGLRFHPHSLCYSFLKASASYENSWVSLEIQVKPPLTLLNLPSQPWGRGSSLLSKGSCSLWVRSGSHQLAWKSVTAQQYFFFYTELDEVADCLQLILRQMQWATLNSGLFLGATDHFPSRQQHGLPLHKIIISRRWPKSQTELTLTRQCIPWFLYTETSQNSGGERSDLGKFE